MCCCCLPSLHCCICWESQDRAEDTRQVPRRHHSLSPTVREGLQRSSSSQWLSDPMIDDLPPPLPPRQPLPSPPAAAAQPKGPPSLPSVPTAGTMQPTGQGGGPPGGRTQTPTWVGERGKPELGKQPRRPLIMFRYRFYLLLCALFLSYIWDGCI